MHAAPAQVWCKRACSLDAHGSGLGTCEPSLNSLDTVRAVEPEYARLQARAAREEQAELDAKAADDSNPSIDLPFVGKIGF